MHPTSHGVSTFLFHASCLQLLRPSSTHVPPAMGSLLFSSMHPTLYVQLSNLLKLQQTRMAPVYYLPEADVCTLRLWTNNLAKTIMRMVLTLPLFFVVIQSFAVFKVLTC